MHFCSMQKIICNMHKENFTLMKIFHSMLKFNLHVLQGREKALLIANLAVVVQLNAEQNH